MYHNFNNSVSSYTFLTALKYTDAKLVFKKDAKLIRKNISRYVFSVLWIRYMKDLYITKCAFINFFWKCQCCFQKGFNAQHCLITMTEKWQRWVDKGGQAGAFLTDLSRALDCIDHELLIVCIRLCAYDSL